jgi:hypothetical protein
MKSRIVIREAACGAGTRRVQGANDLPSPRFGNARVELLIRRTRSGDEA